jgi:predicted dehydrogenase
MELGYDLLLEKPISNKLEDIVVIAEAAKRLGRTVFVCHVLRYTVFYKQIKKLLNEGVIGQVKTIEAAEHVGYQDANYVSRLFKKYYGMTVSDYRKTMEKKG